MKITSIHAIHLRNNEHFMFHTEFRELVAKHGAEALKIRSQFETYLALFDRVAKGNKKIKKSALTAEMQEADRARDIVWSGIVKMNSVALKHYNPDIKKAAQRLKIIFDTYGSNPRMPLIEQTLAINNTLHELQGKHKADVISIGIEKWVSELQARNNDFIKLMKDRFDETASQSDVVLREARALLDDAYRTIIKRINALVVVEGVEQYEQFIRSLNTVIDEYASAIARRSGKKKAADSKAE
jgi:hypothetical protein